jgi:hypothetical protein
MSVITLIPSQSQVTIDSQVASGVDMSALDPDILSIKWFGTGGEISYTQASGESGLNTVITSITPYQAYIDEAAAIIYAQDNPVTYYTLTEPLGQPIVVTAVGWPQPPNTTELVPPTPAAGQTLQWDGFAWVVASFDITLSLPQAKTSLIKSVTSDGAAAVNSEVSLYSTVQQIEAPSVAALSTLTYPGTTIGEYQTYIDGIVATATATIDSATSVEDLYSFNPAEQPYAPSGSGIIFTGRGAGLGPEDLNISNYVEFNSASLTEAETELYVPGTSTVIPYTVDPGTGLGSFDSLGNCFNVGDYLIQIRQVSTSFVIAEFEVPLNPAGEDVAF